MKPEITGYGISSYSRWNNAHSSDTHSIASQRISAFSAHMVMLLLHSSQSRIYSQLVSLLFISHIAILYEKSCYTASLSAMFRYHEPRHIAVYCSDCFMLLKLHVFTDTVSRLLPVAPERNTFSFISVFLSLAVQLFQYAASLRRYIFWRRIIQAGRSGAEFYVTKFHACLIVIW